jgi:hypothetical protein
MAVQFKLVSVITCTAADHRAVPLPLFIPSTTRSHPTPISDPNPHYQLRSEIGREDSERERRKLLVSRQREEEEEKKMIESVFGGKEA